MLDEIEVKKERKREGGKEKREERLRGYKRGLVVGGREGGGKMSLLRWMRNLPKHSAHLRLGLKRIKPKIKGRLNFQQRAF